MKTASGASRQDDAWEPHAFVAPRGIKEHLWLALLIACVGGTLTLRGGWYVLIVTAVLFLFWRVPSRAILSAGILWLLIALAANSITDAPPWKLIAAASWWGTTQVDPNLFQGLAQVGVAIGLGVIAVGVAHAYDCRAVDRSKVDTRVWERQTRQRRRVLRKWAKQREVPEVLP